MPSDDDNATASICPFMAMFSWAASPKAGERKRLKVYGAQREINAIQLLLKAYLRARDTICNAKGKSFCALNRQSFGAFAIPLCWRRWLSSEAEQVEAGLRIKCPVYLTV